MIELFTDRRDGPQPRTVTKIGRAAWGAFAALVRSRLNNSSFGCAFPERCSDGSAMYGCDEHAFWNALQGVAAFPKLEEQFRASAFDKQEKEPPTDAILDGLEWCASKVGFPTIISNHDYFSHHHLRWDRDAGLRDWISEVNQIFSRQGLAYEMHGDGRIRRVVDGPAADLLSRQHFNSGDVETDRLLDTARRRFFDRDADAGQNALEALWDAFERLKTHSNPNDKKASVATILSKVAHDEVQKQLLEREMLVLTDIGNQWRIRHHEINKSLLGDGRDLRDYLFLRMFCLIQFMITRMAK